MIRDTTQKKKQKFCVEFSLTKNMKEYKPIDMMIYLVKARFNQIPLLSSAHQLNVSRCAHRIRKFSITQKNAQNPRVQNKYNHTERIRNSQCSSSLNENNTASSSVCVSTLIAIICIRGA